MLYHLSYLGIEQMVIYPSVAVKAGGLRRALLDQSALLIIAAKGHRKAMRYMESSDFQQLDTYQSLERVVNRLLSPGGCPWDREQTHHSLKQHLLEECYELLEAIDGGEPKSMAEELGDILVQVVFHIHLAQEQGEFTAGDVFTAINEKLIRRHPHVFGGVEAGTSEQVMSNWEVIKQQERADASRLGNVPKALPALVQSQLVQRRAGLAGFDWDNIEGVWEKLEEEIQELRDAVTDEEREWELGDALFCLVNMGKWMNVQSEESLRRANGRFQSRFTCMEDICKERGVEFTDLSMDEKEALWQEAKVKMG